MNNLTTKQKVIMGVIIGVMTIVIGICGYSMIEKEEDWEENALTLDENLENESTNQQSNSVNDANQDKVEQIDNLENTTSLEIKKQNGYDNLEGKIVIHITGAVQKTGILILPEGARIADAIDTSGGPTESADLDEVNLAYVLQDGQKVYIPSKGDKVKLEGKAYITSESGNNVIVQEVNEKGGNKKVNINTATQSELENLPGVGEAIASRIIEYRQQNGKFSKIEDLQNVKGIGDAKLNNIKEYVMVK